MAEASLLPAVRKWILGVWDQVGCISDGGEGIVRLKVAKEA